VLGDGALIGKTPIPLTPTSRRALGSRSAGSG
jgi:hypothetical protein